jgi:hypothetical protein
MPSFNISSALLIIAILLILAHPAHAFGAGNIASISRIEGLNCKSFLSRSPISLVANSEPGRHGDIEDTLLTLVMSRAAGGKKFDKMNVARVYFGNWLRDYCELPAIWL